MKITHLFTLLLIAALPSLGAPPIVSTFSSGLEGWNAPGTGDPGAGLTWKSAGYIEAAGLPYVASPSSFGGNRSLSYGAEFSFRMMLLSETASGQGRVRFTGTADPPYLEWSFPVPETQQGWQTIHVPITAAAGWVVPSATPRPATEAEIRAVLANLSFIQILMPVEIILAFDDISLGVLDPPAPPNVTPLPPSAILVITGLAGATMWEIRRRRAARS